MQRPSCVDPEIFRRACARYATGITITTVIGTDGAPHGLTANSFTSVSLSPPLVLVCVDHSSAVLKHFRASRHFGVNILNEHQRNLSSRFAKKGHDRFNGVKWLAGETGVPLLPESLASFECALTQAVDAGDHAILIGKVVHAAVHEGRPLVYFNSGYRKLD